MIDRTLDIIISDMKPHIVILVDDRGDNWAEEVRSFVGKEILIRKNIGDFDYCSYRLYTLSGNKIGDHVWRSSLKYFKLKDNFMSEEFL